jgi:hypothetical protein
MLEHPEMYIMEHYQLISSCIVVDRLNDSGGSGAAIFKRIFGHVFMENIEDD